MEIQIISYKALDKKKWNQVALGDRQLLPGSIFISYEYLSAVSKSWYGLIVDDYVTVMPLIIKQKWGLEYLSVVPFARQLGVVGRKQISLEQILNKVLRFCKYGDLVFNEHNSEFLKDIIHSREMPVKKGKFLEQPNYVISLKTGYDIIKGSYDSNLRREITKAKKGGLELFIPEVTPGWEKVNISRSKLLYQVFDQNRVFLQKKMGKKYDFASAMKTLEDMMNSDFGKRYFYPWAVLDAKGCIQMLDVFAMDHARIYKMMSIVTESGRKLHAMAFGVDALLKFYSNQALIFDFMGSSLPGVRHWIENFGAKNDPYYIYRFNALPWPVNLLKGI